MGSSLELQKSSSHQQYSKVGKERVLLPQSKQTLYPTVPEKLKMKSPVRPRSDLYSSSRKETDFVREKSSMHWQGKNAKGSPIGDDELVRHMSNLPDYLQRAERGENLQEKPFSVGVLDWTRLEHWKHQQMHGPIKSKHDALCSGDNLSLKQTPRLSNIPRSVQRDTPAKPHSSLQSGLISSHKEYSHCVTSVKDAIHSLDSDSGSKSTIKGQRKTQRACTSSGRNNSSMMCERERTKRLDRKTSSEMNVSSHGKNSGVLSSPKKSAQVLDGKANKRTEKPIETSICNKDADERIIEEVGKMALKSNNYDKSCSLYDRVNIKSNETKKKTGRQRSDVDLHQQYVTYKQHVNLLLKQKPKELDEEFQSLDSGASLNGNVTDLNSSIYSEIFSPEDTLSSECGSQIPYSCPLPSLPDIDAAMDTMHDRLVNSGEPSSATSQLSSYSNQKPGLRPSEGKRAEDRKSDLHLAYSEFIDTLEALDDGTPEQGATKGRHPSPNRRFSFSLGRMGRSFSFKETSTAPQLSASYISPKSGPVISNNTSCSDSSDSKKVNGHSRTRSSPLRRLIEPILKHKSSTAQQYNEGNFNSLNLWPTGPAQKKQAAPRIQALLQFTMKNGFPLFKLLVDNNRNILVATVKDLASSGKNDSGQNYTFYLVNEIKRKNGGWMRSGNRETSYGYAYNVIGQMKVNSELKTSGHDNNGRYMLRESVLFGAEMRPAGQDSAIKVIYRELAAVVRKIPIENLNHNGQQSNKVPTEDCMKSLSEDNSAIILPGAVHGSPSSGEPTPLINRWRTGGLCDCGGWDVGCKLRVLSIPNKLNMSKCSPIPDRFEFFDLGGHQNKPVFSLAPLKGGIFEVHFDSSISMLQAFFMCVDVLSCQKSADPLEPTKLASVEKMKDPHSNGINAVREKAPATVRYAQNPPLSPVGRV